VGDTDGSARGSGRTGRWTRRDGRSATLSHPNCFPQVSRTA
jgi:hypothetical protein